MPTHEFRFVGVGSRSGMDGVNGPGKMPRDAPGAGEAVEIDI